MASYQPVAFNSPGYDYGTDLAQIERRRAMAQMLQQHGLQQDAMVPQAGPGQFQARVSPFQMAAKLAQTYAGGRQMDKADQQQRALSERAKADLASVLQRGQAAMTGTPVSEDASGNVTPAQPGSPSAAASIYMQDPRTAPLGMQMQQQEMERQRRQQMMKDILGTDAQPQGGAPSYGQPGFQPQGSGGGVGGISPQALALMLSGDKELASLGGKLHEGTQTAGRVFYDQNNKAYTLDKSGRRIDIAGTEQGISPADRYKIPLQQAETYFTTGLRPGPLGVPQTQAQAPQVPTPSPAPVPSPSPSPQLSPGNTSLTPKQKAELEAQRPQATFAVRSVQDGMERVGSQIDKLLANKEGVSGITGPVAGRLPSIKGESTNAQADLDALKSMMSVQELQRMRDASKTGGAVGQVTEKEWPRLEAQWAALQQSQTTEEFRTKLAELRATVRNMQDNSRKAFEDTYGKLDYTPSRPGGANDPLGIRR